MSSRTSTRHKTILEALTFYGFFFFFLLRRRRTILLSLSMPKKFRKSKFLLTKFLLWMLFFHSWSNDVWKFDVDLHKAFFYLQSVHSWRNISEITWHRIFLEFSLLKITQVPTYLNRLCWADFRKLFTLKLNSFGAMKHRHWTVTRYVREIAKARLLPRRSDGSCLFT